MRIILCFFLFSIIKTQSMYIFAHKFCISVSELVSVLRVLVFPPQSFQI